MRIKSTALNCIVNKSLISVEMIKWHWNIRVVMTSMNALDNVGTKTSSCITFYSGLPDGGEKVPSMIPISMDYVSVSVLSYLLLHSANGTSVRFNINCVVIKLNTMLAMHIHKYTVIYNRSTYYLIKVKRSYKRVMEPVLVFWQIVLPIEMSYQGVLLLHSHWALY